MRNRAEGCLIAARRERLRYSDVDLHQRRVGNERSDAGLGTVVTVTSRARKLTIVCVDMKSGHAKGYARQSKSTRQFMRCALGLQQEFQGTQWPALDERFVVLFGGQTPLLNKQATVPKPLSAGTTRPDAPIRREVPNGSTVRLKEFVG